MAAAGNLQGWSNALQAGLQHFATFGGAITIFKHMKVNGKDYPIYYGFATLQHCNYCLAILARYLIFWIIQRKPMRSGTSLPLLSTSYKLFKARRTAKHEPGKLQVETDMESQIPGLGVHFKHFDSIVKRGEAFLLLQFSSAFFILRALRAGSAQRNPV